MHVTASNPFGIAAFEAAYAKGDSWLDALMTYLNRSRQTAGDMIRQHLQPLELIEPEGTYLLWLDCRALGMSDDELKRFFVRQAKVGFNPGAVFGEGGSGFMRINIGSPIDRVIQALEQIASALKTAR